MLKFQRFEEGDSGTTLRCILFFFKLNEAEDTPLDSFTDDATVFFRLDTCVFLDLYDQNELISVLSTFSPLI